MKVKEPLKLPCGATLSNRLAKSAMSENLASDNFAPGVEFENLYRTWVNGETGLLISGNVMIDSKHLGEANNVVIEKGLNNHKELKDWASVKDDSESKIWIQLNHPGKQSPKFLNHKPLSPSAVKLSPPLDKMFNEPKELNDEEINDIIERFGYAAKVVKDCGFDGVQIHGAHGYLVSQFLSPLHNKRDDKWGGSLENRMRFALEVYKSIRKNVGEKFPIGIKLNSSDFKKGGFSHEEAIQVTKSLSDLGIDLIEISGGSYETPVMVGTNIKESTKRREAYFLEYARDIKEVINCPLMVTGGFRTGGFIEITLKEGDLDLVGIGRALCLNPNFSKEIMESSNVKSEVRPLSSGVKLLDQIFPLEIIYYSMQIHLMGKGKMPNPKASVYKAIWNSIYEIGFQGLKRVRS